MFQALTQKLSVKLAAAFFTITIVTILSGGAILFQLNALIESSEQSYKTRELMTVVSAMKESMLNSETGLRGFLLLRDERELRPYVRGLEKYKDSLNMAQKLMEDDQDQQEILDKANKAVRDWIDDFADPVLTALKKDDSHSVQDELARYGSGREKFDIFRDNLRDLEKKSREKLSSAENKFSKTTNMTEIVAYIAIVISPIVAILLSIFTNRTITAPVMLMTSAMGHLSRKEYGTKISGANRRDEIGKMAETLVLFRDSLQQADVMAAEREATREADNTRRLRLETLTQSFLSGIDQIISSLGTASDQVRENAQTLAGTAQQTNSQASAVAATTNHATNNVQTVATAAEELSASIREVARRTEAASNVVRKAVSEAEETNSVIKGLALSADRIGEIVGLIQSIAGQTNLLALNATIEAARAGDAGKGFAVVASEVKNLATQTARATDDIQAQIATVQEETRRAVSAIDRISSTIRSIDDISASVAAAIEEQGSATQEIARNVNEAAKGTAEVNSTIVSVSEAATETGHAAQEMLNASNDLAQQAQSLKTHVNQYISQANAV